MSVLLCNPQTAGVLIELVFTVNHYIRELYRLPLNEYFTYFGPLFFPFINRYISALRILWITVQLFISR